MQRFQFLQRIQSETMTLRGQINKKSQFKFQRGMRTTWRIQYQQLLMLKLDTIQRQIIVLWRQTKAREGSLDNFTQGRQKFLHGSRHWRIHLNLPNKRGKDKVKWWTGAQDNSFLLPIGQDFQKTLFTKFHLDLGQLSQRQLVFWISLQLWRSKLAWLQTKPQRLKMWAWSRAWGSIRQDLSSLVSNKSFGTNKLKSKGPNLNKTRGISTKCSDLSKALSDSRWLSRFLRSIERKMREGWSKVRCSQRGLGEDSYRAPTLGINMAFTVVAQLHLRRKLQRLSNSRQC